MRCSSQYQNVNMEGKPLGAPKRCTGLEGHEGIHYNFNPGHKVKWPESAAVKSLPEPFPIPDILCGIKGCAFLKLHEGTHSWQRQ